MKLPKIDTYDVLVEPFHVDFTGHIFLGVLGNHLLNAAGKHSQKRGWGIGALNETQHTWVLSRLCIEMNEMPKQYEQVSIQTWVEGVMKLFTSRNFAILRPDGTPYGYARSIWAMIDTDTRQPTDILGIHEGLIKKYIEVDKACPIAKPSRVKMGNDVQLVQTLEARYHDIDVNGHINSVKYIEHILDLWPLSWYKSHPLKRLEIAYVSEGHQGDILNFYTEAESGLERKVSVVRQGGGELCRASMTFF